MVSEAVATGRVTIAGIGPGGSASLLTLAARDAIRDASLVIYAGVMISDEIRALATGTLLTGRHFDDEFIRQRVLDAVSSGAHVALLEPGDPALYSGEPGVFSSAARSAAWLRSLGIATTVVPGVSSLFALTARLGIAHATDEDAGRPLVVYAPGRDGPSVAAQRLELLCAIGAPIALFLAIERIDQIVAIARRHFGEHGRIIIGYRVGWDDERIVDSSLAEISARINAEEMRRHALVLIGPWSA